LIQGRTPRSSSAMTRWVMRLQTSCLFSFFVLIHVFVVLWVWVFSQDASGNVRGAVSSYPQDAQARVAP
jgi:hypothetical protein